MVETNPEAVEAPAHEQKPQSKIDYFWPFKMERADAWMVLLTAIIALTGIAGFVILRGQLIAMQGQLDEMRSSGEDTKLLIKAAQDSAKAAQDAVKLAEDTAKRQLRAYLAIEHTTCKLKSIGIDCSAVVKNFGTTLALNVKVSGDIFTTMGEAIFHPKTAPPEQTFIIGNGWAATFKAEWNMQEGDEMLAAMKTEMLPLCLVGAVDYRDIYGTPHHLKFNMRSMRFRADEWTMSPQAEGNESD